MKDRTEYHREYREKNKELCKARTAKWRKENPDKFYATMRKYSLKKKYKLTVEQAEIIYSRGCEICGKHTHSGRYGLHIDHCHKTGQIRGCLCHRCNSALGYLGENPRTILQMYNYIVNKCQPLKDNKCIPLQN